MGCTVQVPPPEVRPMRVTAWAGLAHGGHQVATGEADRGDEAGDALVGQGVLLIKSAISFFARPL